MFSDVVMEVGKKYFEQLIDEMKEKKGVKFDVELTQTTSRNSLSSSRLNTRLRSAKISRPILRNSSATLSRPYSVPGTTPELTFTAVTTISRIPGVPLSTYR